MKYDFRRDARKALERAKTELATLNDDRLRYAALELRMCIESLAYERALDFEDDLQPDEFDTWQPKKLVELLVEIDPTADQSSSFRIREETGPDEPEAPWMDLGEERVFSIKQIGSYYHRLGGLLHQPTLKNLLKEDFKLGKHRKTCEALVLELESVLSSPIYNAHIKAHATIPCDCGRKIRKRVKTDGSDTIATCECNARYLLKNDPTKDGLLYERIGTRVPCKVPGCSQVRIIVEEQLKPGFNWRCSGCNTAYKLFLGLDFADKSQIRPGSHPQ